MDSNGNVQVALIIQAQANIQARDLGNLLLGQVKRGAVQVLRQALGAVGLWNHDDVALRGPAEEHLRRRLAVPVRHRLDDGVLEERRRGGRLAAAHLQVRLRAEAAVRRHDDAVLLRHVDEVALRQVRVVFDLQHRGPDLGVAQHVVEELGVEVGYANRLEDAVRVGRGAGQALERGPCLGNGDGV